MTKERFQRKLAAIVAADVVGWSRLMGWDKEGALDAFKRHRGELIDPKVAVFGGRLVGTAGDGMLFEFPSALGAATRASRLEAMAEPSGISVSAKVFEEARNRLVLEFEYLGEQTFKNISHPVHAYRIALDPAETGAGAAARPGAPGAAPTAKSSTAILPFENMSGDPEQEYFSDGITEDVITALSCLRWFFVIARNSTFVFKGRAVDVKQVARDLGVHYVLEGSVRKAGNRLRLNAWFVDGSTGNQLWTRRYDRELEDIFAVQDELAEVIVGAIEPELGKAERERAKSKRPESLGAWETRQRGLSHLYRYTKEDLDSAQALFE